jgi:tRNA A-37 threonylcarbamoyl transferase component Bud32
METSEHGSPSSTSNEENRVLDLLLEAEEKLIQGQDVSAEELCKDYPELIPKVAEGIRLLKQHVLPPVDSPADLAPGSKFDGCIVFEEVGHGGRGVVYRILDEKLNRLLAVKVLLADLLDHQDSIRRFDAEVRITSQLQHPGIVPVHATGTLEDGRPYFTMKLVQGSTLESLLAKRPTPTHDLPRFLNIFQQVCQAVAYAHSRHVIHRDLKPANVMVGAFAEVQVMDWGLAKVLKADVASRGVRCVVHRRHGHWDARLHGSGAGPWANGASRRAC